VSRAQHDEAGYAPPAVSRATRDGAANALSVASYAMVLVLTVLCVVWGAFLVPLRIAGVTAPVSLVFALANAPLTYAGSRVFAGRGPGVVPVLVWLGLVLRLGTPTSDHDIIITSSGTGYVFLITGFVAALVGLAAPGRVSRR